MTKDAQERLSGQGKVDALKGWTMVLLPFVFVLLYGSALLGWLKPLSAKAFRRSLFTYLLAQMEAIP